MIPMRNANQQPKLTLCLFVAGLLCAVSAQAASLTLNFNSPSGTITDTNGVGTGFTARMPGTGDNITNNDPNLILDTGAGVLHMHTSPGADFNVPAAMPDATVVGVNLSTLGFNGGNDFSVTANFINITTPLLQPDPLCMRVRTASHRLI